MAGLVLASVVCAGGRESLEGLRSWFPLFCRSFFPACKFCVPHVDHAVNAERLRGFVDGVKPRNFDEDPLFAIERRRCPGVVQRQLDEPHYRRRNRVANMENLTDSLRNRRLVHEYFAVLDGG